MAADRRITDKGKFVANHKKVFRISHLNAGVGYFGLAYPTPNRSWPFSNWLPDFIKRSSRTKTLGEFAQLLTENLNKVVSKSALDLQASGFHICGYNERNQPEMWFISNIEKMDGFYYSGLSDWRRL